MTVPETPADGAKPTSTPPTGSRRRRVFVVLMVLLAAGVGLGLWLHYKPTLPKTSFLDDDDDIDPELVIVNPGFVGAQACAECHASRVAEFSKTRHYLACTLASGARAAGFTAGRGYYQTHDPAVHFEMQRSGDELNATTVQATPTGPRRVVSSIGLVYGAGGHKDEMYFSWQDDRLYSLPVAWMYSHNCWADGGAVNAREAFASCLECHNTWIGHVPGTVNQFRRDGMILGVSCERCHGPARDHVAYHQKHPDDPAHAIVHPGTLPREKLMAVCAQCHSTVRRRGPIFSFRPGDSLEAHYRTVEHKYPEEEQVVNQVRYLRQSKCFQKSEMTCVTCHNPHRLHESGQRGCLKCHTNAACTDQPHQPEAVRNNCVGCHMPERFWTNVRYNTPDDQYVPVASRPDHRIAVYPEGKQAVLLAWLRTQTDAKSRAEAERIAGLLAKHWLDEADKRQRDDRLIGTIDALREALKADPSPATRKRIQQAVDRAAEFHKRLKEANSAQQPDEQVRQLKRILEIKPNIASIRSELGRMYLFLGNRPEAYDQLRQAAQDDPTDSYPLTNLALLAYQEGRWADAAALLANADDIDPFNAEIHLGWGAALLKQERWTDAADHYRRTLTIVPRHAGASDGLGEALLRQGEVKEALLHARRAVRWTNSKDAKPLLTLAEAYASARRPADARKALEQALTIALDTKSDLVPTIQARLRSIK